LGANATTPAIQEDASAALWEEWVDGESHEKGLYNSIALECERRMSKAAVLSKHHGSPNSLRTAVAFDCLDKLGRVFSRYGMVFDTLRGELERSIYVDGIVSDKHDIEARTQTTTALMANATQHHRKKQAQEQRQQRHWDTLKASLLGGDDDGEEEEEEEPKKKKQKKVRCPRRRAPSLLPSPPPPSPLTLTAARTTRLLTLTVTFVWPHRQLAPTRILPSSWGSSARCTSATASSTRRASSPWT
jgi:hypothetical protein